MNLIEQAKKSAKATTATAIGGFVVANPMIATFALGVGLALWWGLHGRGQGLR